MSLKTLREDTIMKINTSASPPPHRLPVLTEVVLLGEHDSTGWPDLGPDLPVLQNFVSGPSQGDEQSDEPISSLDSAATEASATAEALGSSGRVEPVFASASVPVVGPGEASQPVAKASPFVSSWWTNDGEPTPEAPPAQVSVTAPEPQVAITESQVVQRVLADLDRQLEAMFDQRIHDVVAPVLARVADTLVRELRQELSRSMHDMVSRAVAIELARHPRGPDST